MGSKEIKVTALTSGADDPSSRFRIRQYIAPLSERGIDVNEFCPLISKYYLSKTGFSALDKISKAPLLGMKLLSRIPGLINSQFSDITWMNREIIAGRKTLEPLLGAVRVFDIDDAIWVGGSNVEKSVREIIKNVDVVFAGNGYLADWCKQFCSIVHVIPTAINTHRFFPSQRPEFKEKFVVGWTGTQHTIKYLYAIESALKKFFELNENSVLLVVSDKKPRANFLDGCEIRWVKWSPEIEASVISEMDVGIMPLPDDEWAKGKCSFKMIQYMACGVPTVVSPVGMNVMVLSAANVGYGATSHDEWVESLSVLYADTQLRKTMGKAGRDLAVNKFSVDVVSRELETIFRSISGIHK